MDFKNKMKLEDEMFEPVNHDFINCGVYRNNWDKRKCKKIINNKVMTLKEALCMINKVHGKKDCHSNKE